MSFYVGFFDPEKQKLVEVEEVSCSLEEIPQVGALMTLVFQGPNRCPSRLWLAFDLRERLSIFDLGMDWDGETILDNSMLDLILQKVNGYRKMRGVMS